jgi:hypothetical protein
MPHRGPAELLSGLPLVQRSYLGALLPESLLHMLCHAVLPTPLTPPLPTGVLLSCCQVCRWFSAAT